MLPCIQSRRAPSRFLRTSFRRKACGEITDPVMAATYLNSIVDRPDIDPRDRAQVILELADCLHAEGKNAESLSWLKIWMELYPGRPEVGAVAYRLGTLYTEMGLTGPARDAYYKALSSAINQGAGNKRGRSRPILPANERDIVGPG